MLSLDESIVGFFGGYGSGKSRGGAIWLTLELLKKPGLPALIGAPTNNILTSATLQEFEAVAGPIIVGQNKNEGWYLLRTGSIVWYRSLDRPKSLEGINAGLGWLDEATLCSREGWRVFNGRVRLPGADGRSRIACTGTPVAGTWCQDEFDSCREDRGFVRVDSRENIHLSANVISTWLGSMSARDADAYIRGFWLRQSGRVFAEFDRKRHLIDYSPDPSLTVDIGVDFGLKYPGVVFTQWIPDGRFLHRGILPSSIVVFDEIVRDNLTTEGLGRLIAQRVPETGKLRLGRIACDPAGASHSSSASEHGGTLDVQALINGIRDEYTEREVSHPEYLFGKGTGELRSRATGVEKMRTLLLNGHEQTFLWFSNKLIETKSERGVIKAMEGHIYKDGTQREVRGGEHQYDHILDALRYRIRHYFLRGARSY